MKGVRLPVIALALLLSHPALAIGRWMGDALANNNPPARNFELPAGIRNSVVRVESMYVVDQVSTTLLASGVVIGARRDREDGRPAKTGMLCVLTADHDSAFPDGVREGILNFRSIIFADRGPGQRAILAGRNMFVRGPGNQRARVDIALMGIPIRDWDTQVPRDLTPAPLAQHLADTDIVVAGFGRTATIDTANRRMDILMQSHPPGTYRAGTNRIDGTDNAAREASARLGGQGYAYTGIRSSMDFIGNAGAETGADAHFLNADSGGPTFQRIDNHWRLIGSHGESEQTREGRITEGNRQWDVLLWEHRQWINTNCENLLPEPSTFLVLGGLFIGTMSRFLRRRG
ncbi:MAG TPA: hypothetical protein PLL78_01225 [Fimbriimonadaceae bacterium]|nr:hypothetical protein [Fimbriimonadaceae bacterium]HRJ95283.1 hypothetical protein [Fimbriimonadaceae bacterium]